MAVKILLPGKAYTAGKHSGSIGGIEFELTEEMASDPVIEKALEVIAERIAARYTRNRSPSKPEIIGFDFSHITFSFMYKPE